jgi:hypothetical protein
MITAISILVVTRNDNNCICFSTFILLLLLVYPIYGRGWMDRRIHSWNVSQLKQVIQSLADPGVFAVKKTESE